MAHCADEAHPPPTLTVLAATPDMLQLPIGVLVTLVYLPLQPHHPVPWSQLGQWLRSGFQCIGGTRTAALACFHCTR